MIRVALVGGPAQLREEVRSALAPHGLVLMDGAGLAGADVAILADDADSSAADRCQALAGVLPCVLLQSVETGVPATRAAALGARATLSYPLEPDAVAQTVRRAAAAPSPHAAGGHGGTGTVVALLAGAGGQGVTTIAHALAGALPAPVAALDLDLAGGGLAARAGLPDDPRDAGLAGEERAEEAFERLARPVSYGRLVPAPARPDLAWLVRDGVVSGLCRAARAAHRWVVADIGRPLGPTVEAVLAADALLLVTRLDGRSVVATRRQLDLLVRLAVPPSRVLVVANGARRRDAMRMHGIAGELGRPPDLVVPDAPDGGEEVERILGGVPALLDGLRGAA